MHSKLRGLTFSINSSSFRCACTQVWWAQGFLLCQPLSLFQRSVRWSFASKPHDLICAACKLFGCMSLCTSEGIFCLIRLMNWGANFQKDCTTFAATKCVQMRQKEAVELTKHKQRWQCTPDCTARQIASRCAFAICLYLNEVIYIHLPQNSPRSMQMSLVPFMVQSAATIHSFNVVNSSLEFIDKWMSEWLRIFYLGPSWEIAQWSH